MRRRVMNFVLFAVVVVGGLALTREEGAAVDGIALCCFTDCQQRCVDQGGDLNNCIDICTTCNGCGVQGFEPNTNN